MNQYAINLEDKRVVLCTSETLENPDYYAVHEDIAHAIQDGRVTADAVVQKIKGRMMTSSTSWQDFVNSKKSQNRCPPKITHENVEKLMSSVDQSEVKDELKLEDVLPKEERKSSKKE